jgi:hypothetical protein
MEQAAMETREKKFISPYLAGVALGLVLLASFLIVGRGLGGSGAAYRVGVKAVHGFAPEHVEQSAFMSSVIAEDAEPLDDFFVLLALGVFLGGAVSSYAAGRMRRQVVRGPRIGVGWRLGLAFSGGMLMGAAARLARGCTSGQALSGGALLSAGSWMFMFAVFAGGYAMAYFVRRQWT